MEGRLTKHAPWIVGALLAAMTGCAGNGATTNTGTTQPAVQAGPVAMRRLTGAQYRATVADIFGSDTVVAGRIEPDIRRSGLLAVGSSFVSVTASGLEEYEATARNIAEQVLDEEHRSGLVPCQPESPTNPDDACAAQFIRKLGRRILRRTLTEGDVLPRVAVAREATLALSDFYAGLQTALSTLLLSPEFLFRIEVAEPDPDVPGSQRLDSTSMASRLSYLLWNTTPDEDLLAAAERGDLIDDELLAAQVDRMLASPRLAASVRAFFSDLYGFEAIEDGLVRKDPMLFPAFSQALINDAREQTLRVITQHLIDENGDYRDLFTTRRSFMTRTLGLVYRVPVPDPTGWQQFEFPEDGQRAGLLTHISLLALYSHPGRSSPTLRGKFVREVLLCQDVPPPPGDIDFSQFAEMAQGDRLTARQRLETHVNSPVCAGCHSLMDPIGLGLEKMDGIGEFRETENGVTIDASGQLDGRPFRDGIELGQVLSENPALGPCFVESLYKYAMGRDVVPGERDFLNYLEDRLGRSGYRLRDLLRMIVLSDAFRKTSGPRAAEETPASTPVGTPAASATPTPIEGGPTPGSSPSPGTTEVPTAGTSPTATPGGPASTPSPSPTATPTPTATPGGVDFQRLQEDIFTPRCATSICHSRQTRAGELVLEEGDAYDELVGVEPANAAARSAGLRRVEPFDPESSFIITKLEGPDDFALGSRMPLVGGFLSEEEIGVVRAWILDGANP